MRSIKHRSHRSMVQNGAEWCKKRHFPLPKPPRARWRSEIPVACHPEASGSDLRDLDWPSGFCQVEIPRVATASLGIILGPL